METYHALTRIAPPDAPAGEVDAHALSPVEQKSDEPEPTGAAGQPAAMVHQTLEELAREGARRMLERALAVEVDEFLGRPRYERRMLAEHGYRNGYGRPRPVAIGTWPVEVRAPRIRDLPDDAPFHSSILPRRRMLSAETQRLFARLYLEGLSSGDFEPAFRELLGEYATLSSSTILRLKEEWASEYAAWRVRPLTARYAYIWSDGIYLGALESYCSTCNVTKYSSSSLRNLISGTWTPWAGQDGSQVNAPAMCGNWVGPQSWQAGQGTGC